MSEGARSSRRHGTAAARTAPVALLLKWQRRTGFRSRGAGSSFSTVAQEHPDRLVASVASGLLRGERVATSEGSQVRDFMHVDDVAGAFVTLVEGEVQGPVNIASGQPTTVRDVITLVAEAAGGLDRVDFGALPMRAGEPSRIVGAADRLQAEAGFGPRIGLAAGLTATVEWWRAQVARERPRHEVRLQRRGHPG